MGPFKKELQAVKQDETYKSTPLKHFDAVHIHFPTLLIHLFWPTGAVFCVANGENILKPLPFITVYIALPFIVLLPIWISS